MNSISWHFKKAILHFELLIDKHCNCMLYCLVIIQLGVKSASFNFIFYNLSNSCLIIIHFILKNSNFLVASLTINYYFALL